MSYKLDLSDIDRGAQASLTAQIAERLQHAIDTGALAPGEKLPTTRALAEQAGINHLTAVRVYRRLAEQGYVTASVGRGTFVRAVPPALDRDPIDWQTAVLPELRPSYSHETFAATYLIPSDPDIVSLAAGAPDSVIYPAAALGRIAGEVLDEVGGDALGYLDPDGLYELREEIAKRGRRLGFAQTAEEIMVTSGARQAIDLVCRGVVAPGDVVVCESPTFIGILSSLQVTGARVIGVPVDENGMDVDALERILARHEVKLVAVQPGCQNPTGQDLSAARSQRLVELARERSFFILEDGVYATVRFDGDDHPRLRHFAPDHVIYVDSLSKTIGGGLRLGWVAASGPVRQRVSWLKLHNDTHTSSLVQYIAHRWLRSGDHEDLLHDSNPMYALRCDALRASLERYLGDEVTVRRPVGGHHLWVTFRRPIDERALLSEAIRCGVTFVPGGAMLAEPPTATSMRLSFARLEPEELDEGVRRLAKAVLAVRHRASRPGRVQFS
ncbi:aminotransferase-like domain-containing protein [Capillimicrobium parvum]|uniref:Histidinol-phosphate aminotransferase n=1 Tax=Capillimicrobium parvum TaxID=2884022 RepID=A0A9E6XVF0_9ACTN|nr:PLP-dependent aminotransferase family protein [Capillimicrobium parvum]UGS34900.1 Histidinol-phosphate aminotransferase [Capillimicrobium parvum]